MTQVVCVACQDLYLNTYLKLSSHDVRVHLQDIYLNFSTLTQKYIPIHWHSFIFVTQVVRIEFQDFSLTNCAGCSCDNLTLYNGESTTAPRIQLMCGTYRPNSIQTTVSALYVTFMSSPITSSSGFYSKYSFHILSGGIP